MKNRKKGGRNQWCKYSNLKVPILFLMVYLLGVSLCFHCSFYPSSPHVRCKYSRHHCCYSDNWGEDNKIIANIMREIKMKIIIEIENVGKIKTKILLRPFLPPSLSVYLPPNPISLPPFLSHLRKNTLL